MRKRDNTISSLKTDIDGLRREIQERDDTIQDKVEHCILYPMVYNSTGGGLMKDLNKTSTECLSNVTTASRLFRLLYDAQKIEYYIYTSQQIFSLLE